MEKISLLECLFKLEGRAWAAGGGPLASITKLGENLKLRPPIRLQEWQNRRECELTFLKTSK